MRTAVYHRTFRQVTHCPVASRLCCQRVLIGQHCQDLESTCPDAKRATCFCQLHNEALLTLPTYVPAPAPERLEQFTSFYSEAASVCGPGASGGFCYSPSGIIQASSWGNMRTVANAAVVAMAHATVSDLPDLTRRKHRCWARSQLR